MFKIKGLHNVFFQLLKKVSYRRRLASLVNRHLSCFSFHLNETDPSIFNILPIKTEKYYFKFILIQNSHPIIRSLMNFYPLIHNHQNFIVLGSFPFPFFTSPNAISF